LGRRTLKIRRLNMHIDPELCDTVKCCFSCDKPVGDRRVALADVLAEMKKKDTYVLGFPARIPLCEKPACRTALKSMVKEMM